MKKNLITLAVVGILGLGSIAGIYVATNHTAYAGTANTNNSAKVESEEADDQELTAENTKTAITEDQAKQTALTSIKDSIFKEIELEDEDGVIVYGVEVQSGNNTYDVKVDANTGSIVKTDQDNNENENGKLEKESKDNDNDSEQEDQNNEPDGAED
nr:PepSY domain-containing protein [uncultured Aminipila sp.]